jgi:DNA-binding transcriptional ArsR family regulator
MAVELAVDPALQRRLLRAVGEPSRLTIVGALRDGERRVVDLVAATGLSQPNVSKHLSCLRDCGLVVRDKRGREVFYTAVDGVDELLDAIGALLGKVGDALATCSDGCCT